jgi:hypothetical protein
LLGTSSRTRSLPAAIDMEAVKTEIQAMEDAFSAAETAKDADAVAAYYSAGRR